jgi:hypothetical protein
MYGMFGIVRERRAKRGERAKNIYFAGYRACSTKPAYRQRVQIMQILVASILSCTSVMQNYTSHVI